MKKSLFAIAACLAFAATGCNDKPERVSSVKIAPTIKTRVTGLHFDTGDCIGLTIVRPSGTFVENRMMSYDGSAFTSQGLLWYNDLNEKSTLTAYFPYSEAGVPNEFSVATDQTAGCASSDLLGAVKREVTPGSAPVGMLFYHLMSQLSILVTNTSEASVSGITISGLVPTAEIDLSVPAAAAKPGAAAADIRAYAVTPDVAYRAVLVPQQAAVTVTVFTDDGKDRSKTISSTLLESGKRYDLSVEVTNIDISLSLSGDINDWQDGGSLDDKESENGGGTDVGGDGTLEYDGETYRTATIDGRVWMVENLRNAPADVSVGNGLWYPAGGAESVASQGMLYNYEVATQGAATRSGTRVRGICPPGWHLPDADELTSLLQSSEREEDFFCCGGFRIVSPTAGEKYGSPDKGYLLSSTLPESGKCNCLSYISLPGGNPSLVSIPAEYGVTVRCVKD